MPTIILRSTDASPTVEQELTLAPTNESRPSSWREFRAPRLPQRITQGPFIDDAQDPLVDLAWSMDDWSGGAGKVIWEPGSNRYQRADGADLRWQGVATNGVAAVYDTATGIPGEQHEADFWLENRSFEGGITGWTAGTGVTLSLESDSDNVYAGNHSMKVVTDGSRSNGDVLFSQSLANPTVYRGLGAGGVIVNVAFWIKRTSGSSRIYPQIADGVGVTSGTTYDPGADDTWELTPRILRTCDTSATEVTIKVLMYGNETGANTYYVDLFALGIGPNSVISPLCNGFAEFKNNLYGLFGRAVGKWDESDHKWDAVYIANETATDIIAFGDYLFVAAGFSAVYYYSSNGTSWTRSTLGGSDDKAQFFARGRDASGAVVLWKNETAYTVCNTPNPLNGGTAWTTPIAVGDATTDITAMYGAFDTIVVGKEDALYSFNRWDANNTDGDGLFLSVLEEFYNLAHPDNFTRGVYWLGWLYFRTTEHGFWRWRPGQVQDLSNLFLGAPRSSDAHLGVPYVMVGHPRELWVVGGNEGDDTGGILWSMQSGRDILQPPHMHMSSDYFGTGAEAAHMWRTAAGTGHVELFIHGQSVRNGISTNPGGMRIRLPEVTGVPYKEALSEGATTLLGKFVPPVWHGGSPGQDKAFLSLTLWVEDGTIGPASTIAVKFGVDGEDADETSLGTFNGTSSIQTKYFHTLANPETSAVGKSIQLEFTFSRDDSDDPPPRLFGFILSSTLRPDKLRTWEVFVRVEAGTWNESTGYQSQEDKSTVLANLDSLEDQNYAISFRHNLDNPGLEPTEDAQIDVFMVDRERVEVGDDFEVHRIVLQEARTS